MKRPLSLNNQYGAVHLLIPALVLVLIAFGGALLYVKDKQDDKKRQNAASLEDQKRQNQAKSEELAAADAKQKANAELPAPAASPAVTPAPSPTAKPTPTPAPAPKPKNPTQANCKPDDQKFTVYASMPDGTPTFFQSARTTRSSITVPYRQAMQVSCFDNDIQKLVYDDYFVNPNEVTLTKP